jgi:hypothetical protein
MIESAVIENYVKHARKRLRSFTVVGCEVVKAEAEKS